MIEIPVTTNAQIDAEEKKTAQVNREIKQISDATPSLVNDIVGHVRSAFEKAKQEKITVQQKMIDNLLQKRGEYDATKLAQIRQLGSEIFMQITDVKCRMALAMLREIYNHPGERCFALEPTPLPKLTPQMEKQAEITFMTEVESFLSSLTKGQEQPPSEEMLKEILTKALPKFKKEYKAIQMDIAKDKARAMEAKIEDQLTEGGYFKALGECLSDLVDLKAGFLKGPIYRRRKVFELKEDPTTGKTTRVVKEEIRPEWDSPSAFDIFPLPGVTDINKGGLIELLRYTRKDLQDMIGLTGFDEAAIRQILAAFQTKGLHQWTWDADEIARAQAEGRDTSQYYNWETIDALEYHDNIPGRFIQQWVGAEIDKEKKTFPFMGNEIDPDLDYSAIVWMVDHWVLKITLNQNPLGDKPYFKASYVEQKGSFWGRGLPETITDGQTFANSAIRGCQNNIGIASGPQIGLDTESLAPGQDATKMWPWKIWRFARQAFSSKTEPFMQFFQPQMHVQELVAAYDRASRICDEHSGIAGFTHGDRNVRGAGNTLGGFAMFAGMQNRGIRDVASVVDDKIIGPSVVALYYENYELDDALEYIGDVKIKAKGSTWLLAKETQALRLNDFLRVVGSSPIFQQIMGEDGLRYGIEETAKNLNLDSRRLVPDKDLVKPIPVAGPNMPPIEGGPNLDQAGNRVQGTDTKLIQPGQA